MRRPTLIAPAVLVLLAVAWASPREGEATTFNPFFGPLDFYRLNPTVLGANSDTVAQFNILQPSSNSSPPFGSITFADSDLFIADSATIPGTGAYMGRIDTVQTVGLANEGCNSVVPRTFDLVEATTDTTALSITNNGPMTLSTALGPGDSAAIYNHPLDPMGVRADGAPVNEIEIEAEQMLITGVNTATNAYTVVRGWNGTTPAAHQAAAEIRRVNVIYPSGPATNLLANLAQDDGDLDNNGVPEFSGYNNNGVADGADAVPSFVRDSFDPNNQAVDGGAQQARARYFGVGWTAGTLLQVFQIVVAQPAALAVLRNLDWATTAWGYPVITFYQDPLGPSSLTYLSDLCNFTSNTTLFGVPHDNSCTGFISQPPACTGTGGGFMLRLAVDGGCPPASPTNPNECGLAGQTNGICPVTTCPRQTNPATARSVRFYRYALSQRDYDNDGYENALDTCHSDPNPNWNPRQQNSLSGGDADGDGLPGACDPNDAEFKDDQDSDGWQNRSDGCPVIANAAPGGGAGTIANTFQFDQDVPAGVPVPDGGPPADDIGPACDVASESCAGCPALTPTGANGHYHATAAAQTVCIGAATFDCSNTADNDGDGVVNTTDTCRNGANPPITFTSGPGATTLSAPAGAGATVLSVNSTAGFAQGQAIVVGSPLETLKYVTAVNSPQQNNIRIDSGLSSAHSAGAAVRMLSFAQSMRDLNNDGFVDISDISLLTSVFGSQGGDPSRDGVGDPSPPGYQGRYDTNYDSFVDISDVAALAGIFGAACGPPP